MDERRCPGPRRIARWGCGARRQRYRSDDHFATAGGRNRRLGR